MVRTPSGDRAWCRDGTLASGAAGHAGVFGATSRVADQSLLTAAVVVCDSPAIGAASATSAASTALGRPTLGVSSQIDAAADQVGQRVDEAVDEVAVVVAPPQQHRVHDVAVVTVDHVGVDAVLDRDAKLVIGVVVPAELLDHHAGLEAQPVCRMVAVAWADSPTGRAHASSSSHVLRVHGSRNARTGQ